MSDASPPETPEAKPERQDRRAFTTRMMENIARTVDEHKGACVLLRSDGMSLRLRRTINDRTVTATALLDYERLSQHRDPNRLVGITMYQLEREIEHEVADTDMSSGDS